MSSTSLLVRYAAISTVLLGSLLIEAPAQAEEPTITTGGKINVPKPGVYQGFVESLTTSQEPLGLMCKFRLVYGFWTLMGEPVEDYRFRWELCEPLPVGGGGSSTTSITRLDEERPDFAKQIRETVPLSVTLRLLVAFYDDLGLDQAHTSVPVATAVLHVRPDLPNVAGKAQDLSSPGSPEWGEWFSPIDSPSVRSICKGMLLSEVDQRAACVKAIWKQTKRIEVREASIAGIEWPDRSVRLLFGRIGRHNIVEMQRRIAAILGDDDFWSKPSPPAPKDEPYVGITTSRDVFFATRPLQNADLERRKARMKVVDQRLQFGYIRADNVSSVIEIRVDVQNDVVDTVTPPVVEVDGKPYTPDRMTRDKAHTHFHYTIPFVEGQHQVRIRPLDAFSYAPSQTIDCVAAPGDDDYCGGSDNRPGRYLCLPGRPNRNVCKPK